jgi:thioredoxin reductase (NADPH)
LAHQISRNTPNIFQSLSLIYAASFESSLRKYQRHRLGRLPVRVEVTTMDLSLALYAVPLSVILAVHLLGRSAHEKKSLAVRDEAVAAGLTEPASLHPVIDPSLCMGCGSCLTVCPEGDIIGLIGGKAVLVEPSSCIGHGACKNACPFDAISLVFGTETRGLDIPNVGSDFQTNVPGIYIAGELGGMGLIRNAIEQGRQALESIAKDTKREPDDHYDVVIVGAGPAGFSASLAAMEKGLKYKTIEQDSLGGTVSHFPRGKLVMTQPATLPIIGKVNFRETTKEALLEFWEGVMKNTGVEVSFQERVEAITKTPNRRQADAKFEVKTTAGTYTTQSILLAIGRRGTPRTLDVPGEELSKVVYRLADAAQYRGRHVLVVGGGDSAIEAACSIAEEPNTTVTLAYRGDSFNRSKLKNRKRVEQYSADGILTVQFKSSVKRIEPQSVDLKVDGKIAKIRNDAVIVCAGGILPTDFLKSIGIEIETKHGSA